MCFNKKYYSLVFVIKIAILWKQISLATYQIAKMSHFYSFIMKTIIICIVFLSYNYVLTSDE